MINGRLLNLLTEAKKYVYYQVLSKWLILFLRIIILFSISNLVDDYAQGIFSEKKLLYSFLFSLISISIIYILEKIYVDSSTKVSINAKNILRKKILQKALKLGITYNNNVSTSNLVQLAVEGVDQLEVCFGSYYPQIFYSILSTLTYFICISLISIKVGISLLICIPLIPISIIIVQKIAIKILGKYFKSYANLGESFLENLQGLTTLKIYQSDEDKEKEMDKSAEDFRIETMKVLVMQLNSLSLMDIMTYGGASIGIIISFNSFLSKNISLGCTFFIMLLSAEFFIPLRRLGSFFHVAMNGIMASEKIFKFLDLKEEKSKLIKLDKNENFDIIIKNLDFCYEKNKKILKKINLEMKDKGFISFVGESGSGKSTIAKILSGILTSYEGNASIQNKEIKLIEEESLSKNIVVISSDSYIFKGSIKDNLMMAKEDLTNEEMINILQKVKLDEFIDNNELNYIIAEEGNNLSGGQRQKLALARALLYDAPFYIFDEATSNIDKESEKDIIKVIKSLIGKKNIIMISHRLYNAIESDKIYILKDGEIIEEGKHDELMELRGEYYKLFNTQKNLENYSTLNKKNKKIIEYELPKNYNNNNNINNEDSKVNNIKEDKNIYKKLEIILYLFSLVKPLMFIMLMAIILGILGNLCVIFIPVKGIQGLFSKTYPSQFRVLLITLSISKGLFIYGEQYFNHYIAFKLLALIRHKIFHKLRSLCPAKLENKEKGNLISLITSDIELIEVFYAHTISPVVICLFVTSFMCIYIGSISLEAGIVALVSYFVVGIVIPIIFNKKVEKIGMILRNEMGNMNSYTLISLRGLREIMQFLNGEKRLNEMEKKSDELSQLKVKFSDVEQIQKGVTNIVVLICSYGIFYFLSYKFNNNNLYEIIIPMVALLSSFGPVIALSDLSIGLGQTFACGKRVKDLLDEKPIIEEINSNKKISGENISINNINFSYNKNYEVIKNFNAEIENGKMIGILGKSGCGKSTLLKLIMRFWDVDSGNIKFGNDDIKNIDTNELRNYESYLTQEVCLFNDTIFQNIKLGNKNASNDDVINAAKKASIHEFIMSLDKKYETKVGELGNRLSSGEKQRIGLARCFLHKPKLLLLDEPTSNLDSLNEGIILKSIMEDEDEKKIIIVSHRESTLDCVDILYKFN